MRWSRTLQLIEAHCEGEVGKVITSGVIDLPGDTMAEKMAYINESDRSLVRLCMLEPRGCAQMAVNVLLPPVSADAHAGFLVLLADGAHPMSGSNCICVATVLLETGIIHVAEQNPTLVLDTPAGSVRARAQMESGKCRQVALDMPTGFVAETMVEANVDGIGSIRADIAFGGEFYALIDISEVNIPIEPQNAHLLADASFRIQKVLSTRLRIQHPVIPQLSKLNNVMFYQRLGDAEFRTCTSGMSGRVDRSPCGTGSTALFALLHDRGELAVDDVLTTRSIIDSRFRVRGCKATSCNGTPGIECELTGRAWIHGIHQIGLDPDDPFGEGFALSDTWGPVAASLRQ